MVSKIYSAVLQGLSAQVIEVEAAVSKGLRSFNIVGLGDKAIEEAKERVGQAIKSIKLLPPHHQTLRVLINLAPADLKKEGSLYDLPIALSYLLASGQTKFIPEDKIILGELALDGRLKPIKGALSFAFLAQKEGFEQIILPKENTKESALVNLTKPKKELKIIGAENLKEVIDFLEGRKETQCPKIDLLSLESKIDESEIKLSWIKGQAHTKRALEIAAAGAHNIFLQGPPGAGKSLLAKAVVSILPKLGLEELLELTKIYGAVGFLNQKKPFFNKRPFRAPHHSSSETALIGGGSPIRPGEITLAHRGVLFLDEFPEFHRDVLESLRNPLEEGKITIQRAKHCLTFPCRFTLIGASNPCPCGNRGNPEKECRCTNSQITSYQRKMSGPLMDRIDIFCWVGPLKYEELTSVEQGSGEEKIRERIERARTIQKERFKEELSDNGLDFGLTNSEMKLPQIKKYCQIESYSQALLRKSVNSGKLSARGYHRVLKVARTIADLEGKENISFENVSEALSYRLREEV